MKNLNFIIVCDNEYDMKRKTKKHWERHVKRMPIFWNYYFSATQTQIFNRKGFEGLTRLALFLLHYYK